MKTSDGVREKTKVIAVRLPCSLVEKWQSKAAASDMNVSDFVRQSVDESSIEIVGRRRKTPRMTKAADPALVLQLARIGNNLNQLGRWCNTYKAGADAALILSALLKIEEGVRVLDATHSSFPTAGGRGAPPREENDNAY